MSSMTGAFASRLTNYKTLADSMATLLFPHAQVVLEDLTT